MPQTTPDPHAELARPKAYLVTNLRQEMEANFVPTGAAEAKAQAQVQAQPPRR